ncbi:hypothetical protein P152DRAFT_403044 [Eremomyces bilateralis CBS 781.70]|uniref:Telomere length regulation protein conserved domain-containing protein n=1 Tax=Eremomyces bilateralis CBS 781.70 TaxID=1392243 RepID=A0A6G1FVA3_9PEZI|nr:uncharacterized protein P152DRAFT_403044 [Eremomyces bilateralis CBS 781.70]KAF1809660.1 hypothetical protein P152DRAFT_403044 [Eremomyces bilateralis CBS 781.70]
MGKIEVLEDLPIHPKPEEQGEPKGKLSLDGIIATLSNQPSADELRGILEGLRDGPNLSFIKEVPNSSNTRLVSTLLSHTISNFWDLLAEEKTYSYEKRLFVEFFRSITGLGAIVASLKTNCAKGKNVLLQMHKTILAHLKDERTRKALWREYVQLLGSGRIPSAVAEAEDLLREGGLESQGSWLGDGREYSRWLSRRIATFTGTESRGDEYIAAGQLWTKAQSLGYSDLLTDSLFRHILFTSGKDGSSVEAFVRALPKVDQRKFLQTTVTWLSRLFPYTLSSKEEDIFRAISLASSILQRVVRDDDSLKDHVVDMVTKSLNSRQIFTVVTLRTLLLLLSKDNERMQTLLQQSQEQFGDKLYIKHAPILHQEQLAQAELICAGYIHRSQKTALFALGRSSAHINGISNRLASTSQKARWLGMVVGMAISKLIDKPENKMDFDDDELKSAEAKKYYSLLEVKDSVAPLEQVNDYLKHSKPAIAPSPRAAKPEKSTQKPVTRRLEPGSSPKPLRERLIGGSSPQLIKLFDSPDTPHITPYAKADSDPDEPEPDPTLVNREKPRPPVYIRNLIAGLNDSENYDRHKLMLESAEGLIRRKANFGAELKDRTEELLSVLIGMQDHFDLDNFSELRQKAVVAMTVAEPSRSAQWLARSFFEGDYSISQRLTILSAMGLGALELSGLKHDGSTSNAGPSRQAKFADDKSIPKGVRKALASSSRPLNMAVSAVERQIIEPFALKAADEVSGPDSLKVRTFSSKTLAKRQRPKPKVNDFAKVVAEDFFFPLTARWWGHIQAFGQKDIRFSPMILPIFLQTLALMVEAAGPSNVSLPQITSELWDILLSLRASAMNEMVVLEAVLFSILVLLEANQDHRRLVSSHPKELVETSQWAKDILDKVENGELQGEKVGMLAAGVYVKAQEIVKEFQTELFGNMIDF